MEARTVSPDTLDVGLSVSGMSCASCVGRVERALKRVPGVVDATVNLASETAHATVARGADGAPIAAPSDLAEAVTRTGYHAVPLEPGGGEADAGADSDARRDILRFAAAVVLTVPLVLPMLAAPLGLDLALPPWAQLALAAPVQLWIGWSHYRGAAMALANRVANMDLLVALGTSAAFGLSLWSMARLGPHAGHHLYFESAAVVITLVLLGRILERRAKRAAGAAIRALMRLVPETAQVERDGRVATVAATDLRKGEIAVVAPGDRVPVDGTIEAGESQLDEALVTGESMPVPRGPGDKVIGGSINGDGLLRVRATGIGADATIARIAQAVERAQASKAPMQRLVDRVAAVFVPAVLLVAVVTFLAWALVAGNAEAGLLAAVAVLVVACPCALGLATPAAVAVGTAVAARAGLLIRDAEALDRARRVRVVAFDKTGTLTVGRPAVVAVAAADGDDGALLDLVAAALEGSAHPLARAIRDAAQARHGHAGGRAAGRADAVTALPGRGVEAVVAGRRLVVGSQRLMTERGIDLSPLAGQAGASESRGATLVFVADAEARAALGVVALSDTLRPFAAAAIARLKADGIETAMLTGDNGRAALAVAGSLGIEHVVAEILPESKAEEIAKLRAGGKVVAMVGDGVNDAPALAAADLGIAVGGGADVAVAAAGLTLMRPDPLLVPAALDLARAIAAKVRQNLAWAFGFNVVAIPVAALGGLDPMIAGAAMA
ncbi:MAG: heavy metal translocating P-type ATPase, partial [Alphaproteobacteria bacterium]|nr:heavy metal translocating P-type ATPase [Alphaproteobacteria bacterium]